MSEIQLPLTAVKAEDINPRNLLIFSKPKTGKTSLVAALPDCLILDLEKGANFVEGLKLQANSFDDLKEIGKLIKENNFPYKYIAVDTLTALEDMATTYAEVLYSKTPKTLWGI